jgi:Spy/CpxP family protein refolding chaperone
MIKLSTFFIAAALSTALVFAQRPGGPGRPGGPPPDPQTRIQNRVTFLGTLLSLTDDQKTQATTIFTNAYTAAQSASSSLQGAHQSLSDAVKTNNTASIDQVSASIGTIQGQLTAINAKADAAFYAILTPDQQAKYDAAPHGGPGGGPGPMGGFGRAGAPRNRPNQ